VAAEHQANPAVQAAGLIHQPTGNTTGKEVRFGVPSSALFGVASTQSSTGVEPHRSGSSRWSASTALRSSMFSQKASSQTAAPG